MRDDIFKRVAVPRSIRTWMRRASNEADAISGRSRAALESSLCTILKRERSNRFQSPLRDAAKESEPLLPGIGLHLAIMASDSEGPLGDRVASEISRRAAMDRSLSARQIVVKSLEAAASSHLDGYVREFESHVRPDRDPGCSQDASSNCAGISKMLASKSSLKPRSATTDSGPGGWNGRPSPWTRTF